MGNYSRKIDEMPAYDVVVCGGGPAGFPAAIAAARKGMKVLVVEAKHQLGGTGTTSLVSHWLGGRRNDGSWAVGGIFRELSEEATRRGIAVLPKPGDYAESKFAPYGIYKGQLTVGVPFDPFRMAPFLEEILLADGIDIVYETWVVDSIVDGGKLTHVVVAGKDGLKSIPAKAFIDATGDADVAIHSGCGFQYGDNNGRPMSISLMIHLENVIESELMEYVTSEDDPRFKKKLADLRGRGVDCYSYDIIIFVKMNRDGYFMINGRALSDIHGIDPASRTHAYITERAKIEGTIALFREYWPGCKDITLRAVAAGLGVRETRRIDGEGYLSVQDVIDEKEIPDTIGFTPYGWDINQGAGDRDPHSLKRPPLVPIPFSVMIPKGLDNLICPGRSINCERVVLGPMRVQAPIMAMGEAAGTAAVAVVQSQVRFADVNTDALRTSLTAVGGIVS